VRDNVATPQDLPDDVALRSREVTDADPFARRLRHGLQSQVSAGGDNFSASQGQRLALARAVAADAPSLARNGEFVRLFDAELAQRQRRRRPPTR
jgi:ABC-type multidrug transport system fused ATPase/permease subunit